MKLLIGVIILMQTSYAFAENINSIECYADGFSMKKYDQEKAIGFSMKSSNGASYGVVIAKKNLDIYGEFTSENGITHMIRGSFDSKGIFSYDSLDNGRYYSMVCSLNNKS